MPSSPMRCNWMFPAAAIWTNWRWGEHPLGGQSHLERKGTLGEVLCGDPGDSRCAAGAAGLSAERDDEPLPLADAKAAAGTSVAEAVGVRGGDIESGFEGVGAVTEGDGDSQEFSIVWDFPEKCRHPLSPVHGRASLMPV